MSALLVIATLVLSGPATPQRATSKCIVSCFEDTYGPGVVCFYEERPSCKVECITTGAMTCKPLVVDLGSWDPRPAPHEWDTKPTSYYNYSYRY